ncbi:MAG TPA: polysaccharide biosynthesis/export family protein, partial [Candidatus Acidoferrales bacterium]|nr:polysaccharide biosynthesis/export family protein [Candidatus Acidoferrales bacterium]
MKRQNGCIGTIALVAMLLTLAGREARSQTGSLTPAQADEARAAIAGSGMSPDEIRQKLHDAGESDAAIDAALAQLGHTNAPPAAATAPVAVPPPPPPAAPADTTVLARPASADAAPEPFGFEMFHWSPSTFEPLAYGPVDPDYPLGPGDEIALTLWGDDQLSLTLAVDREGLLALPDVGQVSVQGLTLEEARVRLRAALARVYSGLKPAGRRSTTFVSVSLGRLRSIQVFLLGDVVRPGCYTMSSVARVMNALYAAGGPTRDGSLRDVRILRGGQVATSVDLYDVVLGGASDRMPRLENGDVVFVPAAERRVNVRGPVRRPALFELRAGEQLRALLSIAGGPLPDAELSRAQIDRIVPPALRDSLPGQGRIAVDVPLGRVLADSAEDVAIADGDTLTLFALSDRRANVV